MKVTVMGLGLNGGGLESARYLALRGDEVTVTDMKDEAALAPSIAELEAVPQIAGKSGKIAGKIRYVLGRHELADFASADFVVKNPGVRPDSPFLQASKRIETDISLFLKANPARLWAVTGSKGKSTTASAIFWVLKKAREAGLLPGTAHLGGNITVSPLSFLDELKDGDDVVLELSSWQLGDLRFSGTKIKPRCAVLTAIMSDHQDRYGAMAPYIDDKREIYKYQDAGDLTVADADTDWGRSFLAETPARPLPYCDADIEKRRGLIPAHTLLKGRHQRKNLLAAGLALADIGLPSTFIAESLASFPGVEHRLELFLEKAKPGGTLRVYNDSAATIPEAAAAAVEALDNGSHKGTKGTKVEEGGESGLIIVTGGTDKSLDFSPLVKALAEARPWAVILLRGTGSDKIAPLLAASGVVFLGPFDDLDEAVGSALDAAEKIPGDAAVVLSPGCASFGMFKNEFDRGRRWKEAVESRINS